MFWINDFLCPSFGSLGFKVLQEKKLPYRFVFSSRDLVQFWSLILKEVKCHKGFRVHKNLTRLFFTKKFP
jgi:hypothetical protein